MDDTAEDAIERGLDAYFAGDTATDLLAAIDFEALAAGEAFEDAVEYERFGRIVGALVGRAAAKGAGNTGLAGRVVRESVASEVGGRVGEATVAAAIRYLDPDALARQFDDPGWFDSLSDTVDGFVADSVDVIVPPADPITENDWTEIEVEDATEE